jgi:hypothetical protein
LILQQAAWCFPSPPANQGTRAPVEWAMENTQDSLTQALDEALEMTFPASDPIAIRPASSFQREGGEK